MSRLPHFLDNRLTDGGEAVSLTHLSPFTPRKIPGTHFCYRLSRPQSHNAAGRTRSIGKSNDLIGNETSNLPACSIVAQPTILPHAPLLLMFSFLYLLTFNIVKCLGYLNALSRSVVTNSCVVCEWTHQPFHHNYPFLCML
jgi:hypothetical protein